MQFHDSVMSANDSVAATGHERNIVAFTPKTNAVAKKCLSTWHVQADDKFTSLRDRQQPVTNNLLHIAFGCDRLVWRVCGRRWNDSPNCPVYVDLIVRLGHSTTHRKYNTVDAFNESFEAVKINDTTASFCIRLRFFHCCAPCDNTDRGSNLSLTRFVGNSHCQQHLMTLPTNLVTELRRLGRDVIRMKGNVTVYKNKLVDDTIIGIRRSASGFTASITIATPFVAKQTLSIKVNASAIRKRGLRFMFILRLGDFELAATSEWCFWSSELSIESLLPPTSKPEDLSGLMEWIKSQYFFMIIATRAKSWNRAHSEL